MTATAPSVDYAAIADALAITLALPDAYTALSRTVVLVRDVSPLLDLSPGGPVARRAAESFRDGGVEGVCLSLDSMRTTRLKETLRVLHDSCGSNDPNDTLHAPLTRLLARAVRLAGTDPASSDISSPSAAASSSAPSTAGTKALGDKPSSPRDSPPPIPPGALIFSPHPLYVVERFVRKVLAVRRGFVPGERVPKDVYVPLPIRVNQAHLRRYGSTTGLGLDGLPHLRGQVRESGVDYNWTRLAGVHLPLPAKVLACRAGEEVLPAVLALQDGNPGFTPAKDVPEVVVAVVEGQFLVRGRRLQRLLRRARVGPMVRAFHKGAAQVSALQCSVERRLDYYRVGQLLKRVARTVRAVEMEMVEVDAETLRGQSHETIRALTAVDGKPLRLCPLCRCAWNKNTEHCCCKCCECEPWDRADDVDEEEGIAGGMFGFGGGDSSSEEVDDEDEAKDDEDEAPVDYAAFFRAQREANAGVVGVSSEWLEALEHGMHERLVPRKVNELAVQAIVSTLRESLVALPTTRLRIINLHNQKIFFSDAPECEGALDALLQTLHHGLEVLVLSKCGLDDATHSVVARAVLEAGENCNLHLLDVRDNKVMRDSYHAWADALEVNTSLEQLLLSTTTNKGMYFYGNRYRPTPDWAMYEEDVLRFYTAAFAHPTLSELHIDEDPIAWISTSLVLHIATCLRANTRMQVLFIQQSSYSDEYLCMRGLRTLGRGMLWAEVLDALGSNHSLLCEPFSHTTIPSLRDVIVRNRTELARAVVYHSASNLPDDVVSVIMDFVVMDSERQ